MIKENLKIFCVLKKSNIYDVDYVKKLKEQLDVYAPNVPLYCISNTHVPCERLPMRKLWPNWWSKIEIFRPDIEGDIFFIDLDTVIIDNISDFLAVNDLTMLTDWNKPQGYGSGLMYLPASSRADVWKKFTENSLGYMRKYRIGGDQSFLMECFGQKPLRWQTVLPGRVLSYKFDRVYIKGIPSEAGIICHHGRPKPRDIGWAYPNLEYVKGKWVRQ